MKNTFGSALALTIFGESHGRAIGGVLDGTAAGVPVDEEFIAACMDKRRARGHGLSTPRVEADKPAFRVNGHTTGTAIALMIENQNTRSGDYAKTADLLRPGHADYTAYAKYHGFQDARGGTLFGPHHCRAGGRRCHRAGALNRAGIDITTHIARCAGISDTPFAWTMPPHRPLRRRGWKAGTRASPCPSVEEPMKTAIRAAGSEADSVGGILETAILGRPPGVGEPVFDSMESLISHMAFSVPAVKGIEFGTASASPTWKPRQRCLPHEGRFGGHGHQPQRGHQRRGITNGMPVVFRTAVSDAQHLQRAGDGGLHCKAGRAPLHGRAVMTPASCRGLPSSRPAPPRWLWAIFDARYGTAWIRPTSYRREGL